MCVDGSPELTDVHLGLVFCASDIKAPTYHSRMCGDKYFGVGISQPSALSVQGSLTGSEVIYSV